MGDDHQNENGTSSAGQAEPAKIAAFRLAAIIEYSDDAIVSKTVDGIVIGWNHGAERLYGYLAEEMIGQPIAILFPPDRYREYLRVMQEVKAGKAVPAFDTERRRKDGTLINISIGFTPIEARDGEVIGISKHSHDITQIKKLEAQFVEAQKMEVIGHLAGGVAHDFNNVLAVIMCYSDMALLELAPESPLRNSLEEIRQAAERAAGLTRQLLVFSSKQTVHPVVLDLNDTINDLDKMLRRLIGENIVMTIIPGKEIGRVKVDSGYVGQVLMNLVINARDAMAEGGWLTIATSDATLDGGYADTHTGVIPGNYVMLSITDTGTGMTDEVKKHLFEAFFTTKPPGKGTGLGLTTCRTIMQQSGGHIRVHSGIGKGTTFRLYFPRVDQPLDVTARQTQPGPLPRGTETLLVVEDEPSLRNLTRRVLEDQGYDVLSASNGQEALRVAQEHKGSPICLVVADVIMPLMGGKVMSEWLKATYPNLKILFTSGYTDDAITHHGGLETGVDFLSKPYTPTTMARKVREMLDR
jgi:PAS domain S-box-containing protein